MLDYILIEEFAYAKVCIAFPLKITYSNPIFVTAQVVSAPFISGEEFDED
jgi:hypothetical protein